MVNKLMFKSLLYVRYLGVTYESHRRKTERYVKKEEQCNDLLAFVDGNSIILVLVM